jgi:hypothetical protein
VIAWSSAVRVVSGDDRDAWLDARRIRITSTDIAKAVTPSGWSAVVAEKLFHRERADNVYFAHGREREDEIARRAEQRFGICPNRFLFDRAGLSATPDGIGDRALGEYKTAVKPLPATVPRNYRDQIFIAQYVMEAEWTLLGWEQHLNGVPVDLEPTWLRIERDQERIDVLLKTADELADFLATERLTLAY